MEDTAYDVIVIGAGAAGLASAYGAAANGARVALVERDRWLGGECPNSACVPTQTLLRVARVHSLMAHADQFGLANADGPIAYRRIKAHKDHVVAQTAARHTTADDLAKAGIILIRGQASFRDIHTLQVADRTLTGRQFVIATGSHCVAPPIEGLKQTPFLTHREMLDLDAVPDSLVVLGGGPVGVEFAQLMAVFGCDVTVLEYGPHILGQEDEDIAALIHKQLEGFGVTIRTGFCATKVRGTQGSITVEGTVGQEPQTHTGSLLLAATGMAPNIDGLHLETIGVAIEKGGITTDEHLRTSVPHIWAVGDVTTLPRFTSTAHYEGGIVAHNVTHQDKRSVDLRVLPRALACEPEIASVGATEAKLRQAGRGIVVGRADVATLGRALIDQAPVGFVKVMADSATGQILGAAIASPHASELIHELALAMKLQAPVTAIPELIHTFPSYAEAVALACADAARQLP